MYLIGYDIGSSSIKAALVDADTQFPIDVIQFPDSEMDMISRQSGWAEQQPEIWWRNLCLATKQLLKRNNISSKQIKAVGISYQMHGLVLVDEKMQVLRPAIIWCDSRAVSIGHDAFKAVGEDFCMSHCLNSPGNFTASKLKWVKDNEPDIFERIHKVLLPGDYIAMRLTQNISTTICGLTEGVFWDYINKNISNELLSYYEISQDLLPEIRPVFSSTGTVTKSAARETGLSKGTQVTYRAGDQPNNAMSLNVLNQGEIAATSGTSGVVYGVVDKPLYDPDSRVNAFAHVNYEEEYKNIGMLLCINGAGIQYSWIKHQIARSGRTYDDMERMLSSVPIGSEGICVLPFGNGSERIFDDQNIGSHISNIEFNRHTRAHLFRASMEGVAFTFVHGINHLQNLGLNVDVIRVGNDNMFRSKTFAMTIASLVGCQIQVYDTTGAIGAAKASGVALGIYTDISEAISTSNPVKTFDPGLNYGMLTQAYNYWHSLLNKNVKQFQDSSAKVKTLLQKNDYLKKELNEKIKQITKQGLKLDAELKRIEQIKERLIQISDRVPDTAAKELMKILKNDFKVDSDFDAQFDLMNNNFIIKMQMLYPNLSYEDLQLCYFLKLKLTTKEISKRLNISIRGLETRRYRLRKKMKVIKGERLLNVISLIG